MRSIKAKSRINVVLTDLQGITVRKEGENLVIARIIAGTMIERQGDDLLTFTSDL